MTYTKKSLNIGVTSHTIIPVRSTEDIPQLYNKVEIKEINKLIRENIISKEENPHSAHNSEKKVKKGEFSIVPMGAVIPKIHHWVHQCQWINHRHFGYDTYDNLALDTCNYNIYKEGDEYDWHIDATAAGTANETKLTWILDLSEEEYEGGELEVIGLKFPPIVTGSGAVFTSLLAHRVTPVTKGTRITLSHWQNGPRWR